MNYAVIENGMVANVVVWDGESDWQPGEGQTLIQLAPGQRAGIGWSVVDGVIIEPPPAVDPAPPVIAPRCTPWQFRAEIRARGIKGQVEALVTASGEEVQEAFEYATEFVADNPLLLALAAQLSPPLSASDVSAMIAAASQRVVGQP